MGLCLTVATTLSIVSPLVSRTTPCPRITGMRLCHGQTPLCAVNLTRAPQAVCPTYKAINTVYPPPPLESKPKSRYQTTTRQCQANCRSDTCLSPSFRWATYLWLSSWSSPYEQSCDTTTTGCWTPVKKCSDRWIYENRFPGLPVHTGPSCAMT